MLEILYRFLHRKTDDGCSLEKDENKISNDQNQNWEEVFKEKDREINDLKEEIIWLEQEKETQRYKLEKEIRILKDKKIDDKIAHEKKIKALKKDYEEKLVNQDIYIFSLSREIRDYCLLNTSLLRVPIEKANAERGIPQKKAHDGYIVLSGRGDDDNEYKYIIQTPYKVSLPYESIKMQVGLDLFYKDILSDLGCVGKKSSTDYYGDDVCYMKHWNLILNAKTGFYEIQASFSHPLTVTERRLPSKKTCKNKKSENS